MTDLPSRVLTTVVRLLPRHRKEWGEAMAAELAAITERGERRRFVASCSRAVLTRCSSVSPLMSVAAAPVFVVPMLGTVLELPSAVVRVEAAALLAILTLLAGLGLRRGGLGPVGAGRAARLARSGGYALIMITFAVLLTTGTNDPAGWWLGGLAVIAYLAGFLRITARSLTGAVSLPITATLTLCALAVWWLPMLLLGSVRAHPALTFAAGLAVLPAALILGARTGSPARGLRTGLAAATATFLLMFLAAAITYRFAPGLAPAIPGPPDAGRIEALDPYVADFLVGALFSGALLVPRQAVSSSTEPVRDLRTRRRTGMR